MVERITQALYRFFINKTQSNTFYTANFKYSPLNIWPYFIHWKICYGFSNQETQQQKYNNYNGQQQKVKSQFFISIFYIVSLFYFRMLLLYKINDNSFFKMHKCWFIVTYTMAEYVKRQHLWQNIKYAWLFNNVCTKG